MLQLKYWKHLWQIINLVAFIVKLIDRYFYLFGAIIMLWGLSLHCITISNVEIFMIDNEHNRISYNDLDHFVFIIVLELSLSYPFICTQRVQDVCFNWCSHLIGIVYTVLICVLFYAVLGCAVLCCSVRCLAELLVLDKHYNIQTLWVNDYNADGTHHCDLPHIRLTCNIGKSNAPNKYLENHWKFIRRFVCKFCTFIYLECLFETGDKYEINCATMVTFRKFLFFKKKKKKKNKSTTKGYLYHSRAWEWATLTVVSIGVSNYLIHCMKTI